MIHQGHAHPGRSSTCAVDEIEQVGLKHPLNTQWFVAKKEVPQIYHDVSPPLVPLPQWWLLPCRENGKFSAVFVVESLVSVISFIMSCVRHWWWLLSNLICVSYSFPQLKNLCWTIPPEDHSGNIWNRRCSATGRGCHTGGSLLDLQQHWGDDDDMMTWPGPHVSDSFRCFLECPSEE